MNPPMTSDPAVDLSLQIRAELADPAPQGFAFNDHLLRQDAALERLASSLKSHGDAAEVERAVALALGDEQDGWKLLKLLELADRLSLLGATGALMALAEHPPGGDERSRFLAGRACEVLLKLPLDLEMRGKANQLCQGPLLHVATYRRGASKQTSLQRPRRVEWAILVALMLLGSLGLLFALKALG